MFIVNLKVLSNLSKKVPEHCSGAFNDKKEHRVKEKCSADRPTGPLLVDPLLVFHQNICGVREKTEELMNSLFPRFPNVLCFSEHNLKQTELEHNLEGYKLGAAYCRKSLLKGRVCICVHKEYNFSNVDLSEHSKEQDMGACALKLELVALNIHVVTFYRVPCFNFNSFLNGLVSITKSLYKVELKIIISGDINIDCLTDSERKNSLMLCYCPTI
jgi:exonuclease III